MVFNRKYYKLCFIIYMFINTLALGYFGIDINYLFILMLLWAVVIIAKEIYKKEFRFTKNYSLLMIIQGLVLLWSTFKNSYSDFNSYVIAIMQLVIYLVMFNNPKNVTKDELSDEIKSIIPLVNILVGGAGLVSLVMYFVGFSSVNNGWNLGMVASRLFGVYFNCNPAAFLSAITIILALLAIRHNYKGKLFYVLNIFIQVLYILLTKCRSALIILLLIIAIIGYYFLIRRRTYSTLKRLVLISGVVVILIGGIGIGHSVINDISWLKSETSRFQIDKVSNACKLVIQGDIQGGLTIIDEVSNGRVSLTKAALEVWQTSYIYGVGANNFKKIGKHETDVIEYWAVQVVHSHNVFLEALVSTGVIGFVLFVIFFVKTIIMIIDLLKRTRGSENYFIVLMFMMIVVSEFIGGLSDYGVFYIYSLSATLAWCFLGYLYSYQGILESEKDDARNIIES